LPQRPTHICASVAPFARLWPPSLISDMREPLPQRMSDICASVAPCARLWPPPLPPSKRGALPPCVCAEAPAAAAARLRLRYPEAASSAYVGIRQHTSAYVSVLRLRCAEAASLCPCRPRHSEVCHGRRSYACCYGPRSETSEPESLPDALSSAAVAGAGRRMSAEGRAATEERESGERERRGSDLAEGVCAGLCRG
jgi:hypothetical protein